MARLPPSSFGHPTDRILGDAPAMQALRAQIRHLASFDALGKADLPTLLLRGETGTGKGLVARVIHDSGPRAHGPFIDVNCAAIPETLLEAELFGFEVGAFTDAKRAKPGLFEAASGGTLFLDEIESLPALLQGKFLTVLEAKRVRRLGAVTERPVDVKLMAATQVDLKAYVADGRFRADLYHRLAVVLLEIPPLRERGGDILTLAQHFLRRYAKVHGLSPKQLSSTAEIWLQSYGWPGNVRELSHLMERVTLLSPEAVVDDATLERLGQPPTAPSGQPSSAVNDLPASDEPMRIRQALNQTGGNIVQAARLLGLSRNALRYRMYRYGIGSPGRRKPAPSRAIRAESMPQPSERSQREATPPAAPVPASGWEQKLVAALAIDLTLPSTADSEPPQNEPWTLISRWQHMVVEQIQGFGGVLIQQSTSPLMAIFGVPRTLEQMPHRAIQAALAIRRLVAEAQSLTGGERVPRVRLAVHQGMVLYDTQADDATAQLLPIGETLSVPVRLLGHAAPGDILVSSHVGPLVEGWFEVQRRELPISGEASDRALVFNVKGVQPRRSPLVERGGQPRSWFVGREQELATLHRLLAQVMAGHGQAVGLMGEPGMGKSRLLYEFRATLMGMPLTYLEGRCLAFGSTTAYVPVLDLLRDHCSITEADDIEAIAHKVHARLQQTQLLPEERAPYLLGLLGVKARTERLAASSPEEIKARTFETLRQMLLHESRRRPLVIAVEDLHWIDTISEEFLASLVDGLAGVPLLFLSTYRSGYHPPWLRRSSTTQMALQPLSPEESLCIIQAVLPPEQVPEPLMRRILATAEGNPFFLEELSQSVREQRDRTPNLAVPETVQGVLMARIDRLPVEEKHLLQSAAVVGMEINLALLRAAAELPDEALGGGLSHLQAAEFVYETRLFPDRAYTFKHALTQQVAYESLRPDRRRMLHTRLVAAIEQLYPDRLDEQVARLAHHAVRGEVWDKAVVYCRQAGTKALWPAAYREAVEWFEQALEALQHLPENCETRGQAVDIRLDLRHALHFLGEREQVLAYLNEAERLAEALGDPRRLGWVLAFTANALLMVGEAQRALTPGQRALAGGALGDIGLQATASFCLGEAYHALGDYGRAIEVLRGNMRLLEGLPRFERFGMGTIFAVAAGTWLTWCLAEQGSFAEGISYGEEALQIAEAAEHPVSLVTASFGLGLVYLRKGDLPKAIPVLERGLRLCQDLEIGGWFVDIAPVLAAAYLQAGRLDEALPLLERAVQRADSLRHMIWQALRESWLSEAYLLTGRVEEALRLAEQALKHAQDRQERGYQAWVLRLRGEIYTQQAAPVWEQAETSYQEALALAEELGMRPLMAHCRLGLGTLHGQVGQLAQAEPEFSAAIELYRDLQMTFWLTRAEATQRDLPHKRRD